MKFGRWQPERVLITVRTYPVPAVKGAEVSCTAGITDGGNWIRLFPINYRRLERNNKFRKYDWVDVSIAKAADPRRESFHVDVDSIVVVDHIDTKRNWQARKEVIFPLKHPAFVILLPQETLTRNLL